MEFLETIPIFPGRHYRFFYGAFDVCIRYWRSLLLHCIFDDRIYYRQKVDFWRSRVRMAIAGLHYIDDQRRAILLYGNSWTISCKDLYGGKTSPYLSGERKTVVIF